MTIETAKSRGATDEAVTRASRELLKIHGERDAAKMLGCNRATIARLAAGLPVMPGTLALAREGLRRLAAEA